MYYLKAMLWYWLDPVLRLVLKIVLDFNFYILKIFRGKRVYKKVEYDEESVSRGDEYIDKLLKGMFNSKSVYDPYKFEDNAVGFHRNTRLLNFNGEVKLHNGYLRGLSSLHRSDHCSLHEEDGMLDVKADLGAGVLNFLYSVSTKFMNIGPTITLHGEIGYLEVHVEFNVDSKTVKGGKLSNFILDDVKGMKIWMTGMGPLNWPVNLIISGVMVIFARFLRDIIENKVKDHISENLPNFCFCSFGGDVTDSPTKSKGDQTNSTTENVTAQSTETRISTDLEVAKLIEDVVEPTVTESMKIKKTGVEVTDVTEEFENRIKNTKSEAGGQTNSTTENATAQSTEPKISTDAEVAKLIEDVVEPTVTESIKIKKAGVEVTDVTEEFENTLEPAIEKITEPREEVVETTETKTKVTSIEDLAIHKTDTDDSQESTESSQDTETAAYDPEADLSYIDEESDSNEAI